MRPDLVAAAVRHGGVFTRAEARDTGYTERELKTLTGHAGGWVVVRRGVYAERWRWDATDDDGRYRMSVHAGLLASTMPSVPSHSSSAVLLGMPMRPYWRQLVHVTRHGVRGGRTEHGVKHHLAGFGDDDLTERDGITCMSLARTAVDVAREFGHRDGVVAADAALRAGASREEMKAALRRMWCWPNVTQARYAVEVADAGAESIGESLLRVMVLELGMGLPETQFRISDGSRVAYADLRLRRHLFEFDGRVKYVDRAKAGLDPRPADLVVWDEKLREDWLRACEGGYGMSRVVWTDLLPGRWAATRSRLAEDVRRSDRLYGGAD
jgi:hypothetical protein